MNNQLILAAIILLTSCARSPSSPPLKEDNSIVFPEFFERAGTLLEEPGVPYDLDGVTLRAITIAANDLIPPPLQDTPCWDRQEAYRYRVIRQGDIIFVRIYANTAYCQHNFLILDSGAQYAISRDGRILRRVYDGQPSAPVGPAAPDAGGPIYSGEPISPSDIGILHGEPDPSFLERLRKHAESLRRDAGPLLPQEPDGGLPAPLDGGPPTAADGGVSPSQ
jgi:hypothetical protein